MALHKFAFNFNFNFKYSANHKVVW